MVATVPARDIAPPLCVAWFDVKSQEAIARVPCNDEMAPPDAEATFFENWLSEIVKLNASAF
jgi:hypothetical protein